MTWLFHIWLSLLPWWSLQVSIRQTLVLPRVYVVENASELSTLLLSEQDMKPHVWWRICVRSWKFILRLHVFLNGCNCTFDSLILPWWSLQVSIRQTLVLPRVYVVENACELSTVLLSEHMNPHVCWRICVHPWTFILRLYVFVNCCNWTFEWVFVPWWSLQVSIRQTLVLPRVYVVEMLVSYPPSCYLSIWIHMFVGEFVCVLGRLSCLCMSLWMVATAHLTHLFCHDDLYKFPFGRP